MAISASAIRNELSELSCRGTAVRAHAVTSIGPSVRSELAPCSGRLAASTARCATTGPIAATVYEPGASPVMPRGRPRRTLVRAGPPSGMIVAWVAPGQRVDRERAVLAGRCPAGGPALQVAREDRERRELREVGVRRIEGEHREAPAAVVTGGKQGAARARDHGLEPAGQRQAPRRVTVHAQRAQVDASNQIMAHRRAAHGRCTERSPHGATREPGRRDQCDRRRGRKPSRRDPAVEHDEVAPERVAAAVGRSRTQLEVHPGCGSERLRERLGGGRIADERDRHGRRRIGRARHGEPRDVVKGERVAPA